MSITNYTELQSAVANWLSRSDLTTLIPDFITLAEAKFNRVLRTRNQETLSTLTPSNGVVSLPTDYLELRRIYIDANDPIELEYLTPENFYLKYPILTQGGTDPSRYYTIQSGSIYLSDITTSQDVKILYYAKIPDLATNSTNWLLTNHPDAYLYGALTESSNKTKNAQDFGKYSALTDLVLSSIEKSDKQGKFAGSAMRVIAA